MFVEVAVPIIAGALSITVGWVVQISSRVTKVETKQEDLPKLITSQFETVSAKLDAADQRLARIERAMNGQLRQH